jgi:hypothetical protein
MCGMRQLMRSPALEIDSIVRGKLRPIAADRDGLRQFAAVRGKKRQFPALSGEPLVCSVFRRSPAISGVGAAMSRPRDVN